VTRTAGIGRGFRAWRSLVTQCCRLPAAAAFAAIGIALAPTSGAAQTPAPASGSIAELLQPDLDGKPAAPPRFRRPGEKALSPATPPAGKFTAPTRIGATPIYGSPTGFGAGNTGFDSSGRPRRKKPAAAPPVGTMIAPQPEATFTPVPTFAPPAPVVAKKPAPTKPRPAEIHPRKAANRPGAVLPPPAEPPPLNNPPPEVHPLAAANRPGSVIVVPPPVDPYGTVYDTASTLPPTAPLPSTLTPGTVPQRPLPIAAGDPYAALGIRAGSFLLFPSLDLTAGYNTNPERLTGSPGAPYFVEAPELQVRSDWDRHSLTADIVGSYTEYAEKLSPSLDVPYLSSKIDGRIDVSRDTQVILENRFLLTTDNPGSPNLTAGLAFLPINTDLGGTLGVIQTFNRLAVTLKGTFDRAVYDDSVLTNGESTSNADRNFNQTAGILRIAYEVDPGLKPFVEVEGDERVHDEEADRSGLERSSVGVSAKAGAAVDLFGSLTGEMAGGYVDRSYQDPTLPDVSGFIADGSLIWQATALTTAKLTAASQVYETVIAPASGELSRDLTLQVDHAFLRWLIGTLKGGYGTDDYVGSPLRDTRYFVSAGLTYKFTPEVQLRGEVRQDWQLATEANFTYMATSFLLGLHLQR
jgi:hypothetical protein